MSASLYFAGEKSAIIVYIQEMQMDGLLFGISMLNLQLLELVFDEHYVVLLKKKKKEEHSAVEPHL